MTESCLKDHSRRCRSCFEEYSMGGPMLFGTHGRVLHQLYGRAGPDCGGSCVSVRVEKRRGQVSAYILRREINDGTHN